MGTGQHRGPELQQVADRQGWGWVPSTAPGPSSGVMGRSLDGVGIFERVGFFIYQPSVGAAEGPSCGLQGAGQGWERGLGWEEGECRWVAMDMGGSVPRRPGWS